MTFTSHSSRKFYLWVAPPALNLNFNLNFLGGGLAWEFCTELSIDNSNFSESAQLSYFCPKLESAAKYSHEDCSDL